MLEATSKVHPQNSNLTQRFVREGCPFKGHPLKTPNFVQNFMEFVS